MRAITLRTLARQRGISLLPALYSVIVFGFLLEGTRQYLQDRESQITADGVATSIIELAKAQARHISDVNGGFFGTYAIDPDTLVLRGYLPVWRTNSDYVFVFPGNGVGIRYTADTAAVAAEIAIRFDSLATLNGNTITVGFANPMDLAVFDTYVAKAGDVMIGTLEFAAGSGANIDMNQNHILDVSRIEALDPVGNTAAIVTNTITADSANFTDLRIQ